MNDKRRLLEPDIKAMVLNHLKNKGRIDRNTTIISEFTVDKYSRRVDLALVDSKYITALEVKSEADNLDRLEGQLDKYLKYFDKVIIVAAPKHINDILEMSPEQAAVWQISGKSITIKRRGKIVPIKREDNLISLMKANELVKLSNNLGIPVVAKNRGSVEEALKRVSSKVLREASIRYVRERFSTTSSLFWQQVGINTVLPHHIDLLSPYKELRELQRRERQKKLSFWQKMSETFDDDLDRLVVT